MKRIRRYIQFFLLMTLAILLVSACSGNAPKNTASSDARSLTSECRVIKHDLSETCVPVNPSRVVALDLHTTSIVLSLGIKPIGGDIQDRFLSHLKGELEGVQNTGNPPNLEKIALLKPDLIMGWKLSGEKAYNQLSQIAPTVLMEWEDDGKWKEMLIFYAEVLGKTNTAEQLMRDYYQRIEEFKQQMGDRLKQTQVSVIRIYQGLIHFKLKDSFPGTILEDAGLPRPPAQDREGFGIQISKERIRDADGDVIFVFHTGEDEVQTDIEKLKKDPLWLQLNAVRQGRIYQVPYYWFGFGSQAANLVIDDLFKYLVKEQ
jgi:iron complex transport system substrate-binding protein